MASRCSYPSHRTSSGTMIAPPPTPNSPENAPAAVAIAARRTGAYYGACWRPSRPLTTDPERAAIFCDVDGTLAPIVRRPEDAHVPEETSRLLGRLARRYGLVACVSGRSVADVRRLVGVGGVAYAGSHGAELLEPGSTTPRVAPAFKSWEGQVKGFVAERDTPELRSMRVRDRGQGADHDLPLARRAGRGQGAHPPGGARPGGGDRRPRDPLGPQGARDPAAGAGGQGPGRCATWCCARGCAARCSAATT